MKKMIGIVLQPLGFQIEDYMIFNSDVEVHRAQSIDQMFGLAFG
jgi:hypothetical protein